MCEKQSENAPHSIQKHPKLRNDKQRKTERPLSHIRATTLCSRRRICRRHRRYCHAVCAGDVPIQRPSRVPRYAISLFPSPVSARRIRLFEKKFAIRCDHRSKQERISPSSLRLFSNKKAPPLPFCQCRDVREAHVCFYFVSFKRSGRRRCVISSACSSLQRSMLA